MFKRFLDISLIAGILLGSGCVVLTLLGNPVNSGICLSCFLENLAGAMQLHGHVRMSYLRPELIGFILGSFVMALYSKRFRVTGGSSPVIRFFLGLFIIVGCSVFIGCPIKMIQRLASGDLTAVAALLGLVFGVWLGVRYIRAGVHLDRDRDLPRINGYVFPLFAILLLLFLFLRPSFIVFGQTGPAAMHAPVWASLAISFVIGIAAQRSGLCITGGLRNLFLVGETTLFKGVVAALFSAFVIAYLTGQFHLGLYGQPASHMEHGWTFLAMTLVGLASVIIDGCPFRQIIKAGQGDVDAAITCFGMLIGAALVIGWSIRSTSAGTTFAGRVAVLLGLMVCLAVVLFYRNPVKVPRRTRGQARIKGAVGSSQ
ncbi:MAG: YedE-related selenium metabolism membrane protein [Thermodesulfobacteria bacterium]|nr:YedE-related selenium metabolism membrane protein [Thermodesulfobacteriota bacterium]